MKKQNKPKIKGENQNMKKLLLLTSLLFLAMSSNADAKMTSDRNGLDENQDWLYFMYANSEGCFFLQPSFDDENVVFTDDHNACKNEHHGKKYIGTFVDTDMWELVHIEKYVPKKKKK